MPGVYFDEMHVGQKFDHPIRRTITETDNTLRIVTEVLELRESKSRPNAGIVVFLHRGYNQRNELVAHCKRSALQLERS